MHLASAIRKLRRKTPHQRLLLLQSLWPRAKARLYYPRVFASFGTNSLLDEPLLLSHPEFIHIGASVTIRKGARLEALPTPLHVPRLTIGNHVNIEQNVHIVCHNRVAIGNGVSITANCSIVDTQHPFDDIDECQKVGALVADDDGFVEIGEGTFIGIGCVILPSVRIGRRCVIGANSVVTEDVPDFSVVAGAPAKVLRSVRKSSS